MLRAIAASPLRFAWRRWTFLWTAEPGLHVGDGDAVCVASEVREDLLGAPKGRFGVDHPVDPAQRGAVDGERLGLGERCEVAEEGHARQR